MKLQTLLSSILAFSALALGACADEEYGTFTERANGANGACPGGWYDATVTTLLCQEGYELNYREHKDNLCMQCAPIDSGRTCNGSWFDLDAPVLCAPGYDYEYSQDGDCKRCAQSNTNPNAECVTDDDCFRTGCSGQLCAAQDIMTTCEFQEQYGCYADEFCGCNAGRCGWADDPALNECLAGFGADVIETPELGYTFGTPETTAAPSRQMCGGFAGIACEEGYTCVDQPGDGCDPQQGGADCIGYCKKTPGKPNKCDYSANDRTWVAKSTEECAAIRFICDSGEAFFDECGCGCIN